MAEGPSGTEPARSRLPHWHRHSSHHSSSDPYDHEIGLVDTTDIPARQSPPPPGADVDSELENADPLGSRRTRIRQSVRKRQNDWTYRRYQKERVAEDEEAQEGEEAEAPNPRSSTYGTSTIRRKYGEVRDMIPGWDKKQKKAKDKKLEESAIDILYENQRGAFFCGIPLYSHNSLLNFDPSPWQTSDFKESPVNITNAQPPDPSWTWAWKTWYVDMSHDVDEEGWEYSLSFRQGFAWHGTHPWFHSWVRRRRWLRKRVKVNPKAHKRASESMHEAHKLNLDYFTIHSATRERSSERDATASAAATSKMYSTIFSHQREADESEDEEEVANVPALLRALKKATVDRKKLAVVKSFIANGGQELHYLAESIPEIMDMFVYQTSRRQVLTELQYSAARSKEKQGKEKLEGKAKEVAGSSEIEPAPDEPNIDEALEQAIRAAQERVQDFEYWSDLKATVKDAEILNVPPPPPGGPELAPRAGVPYPIITQNREPSGTVIKGIPQSAGVGQQVGIARRVALQMQEGESARDKGKGKDSEFASDFYRTQQIQEEESAQVKGKGKESESASELYRAQRQDD